MKNFLLFLLVVCVFSTSCTPSKKNSSDLQKIKLALNWVPEPEFGGFYAAKLNKIYEKYGLDVEIIVGGAGSPTVSMVAAKQVEFGITSGGEVIVSNARGAKVKALYAVYQKSPLMIMAHQSRKLKSLREALQSGTLAIERGGAFGAFLDKKFGFSKVKVVPYAGGIASFLHDPTFMQQGFATAEPILAKREGADPQVFLLADIGFNPYMETLTANTEWVEKNSTTAKAMVEATRQGWEIYLKNSTETNQFMASLNKVMDLNTFQEGAKAQVPFIENAFTKQNKLGAMSEERWKEQSEQLKDLGIVDKVFPAKEYFENI